MQRFECFTKLVRGFSDYCRTLSHGKIDKETQSPLLNIFKEIMTREKDDPEKRNLLNEQREEKKRRQYSVSRKADRRSCESSSSEHRKKGTPYKISSTDHTTEFLNKTTSKSKPYRNEKKDSWWFWQQNDNPPVKTEDSCSCVSCALKKIVSSEYACIGCLLLIFTISIIVAFLVVFKNVPNIGGECKIMECTDCQESTSIAGPTTPKCKESRVSDSERLKRKIENLSSKRLKKGFLGVNEFLKNDHKGYDDVLAGHIGVPGVAGVDFGPSFRELNSMEHSAHRLSKDFDLSTLLDHDNMDIQNNEKLRDFYKKLLQTDAKIKSLKKNSQDDMPYVEDDVLKSPERSRRSLKLYHYPKRYRVLRQRRSFYGKQQKVNETSVTKTKFANKTRLKRHNDNEDPTAFVIEKKKLLVQYRPAGKRRIPVKKCQHAPYPAASTHAHEKQMMHPFYKNTQKLDMLLDRFLNRNLPEIMSDPFGIDELFKHEKHNKQCKHPKPHKNVNIIGDDNNVIDQIPKPKYKYKKLKVEKMTSPDLFKLFRPESTPHYERDFYNHEVKMIGTQKKKIVTASPNEFEVLLSVSTIMNPELQKLTETRTEGCEGPKSPNMEKTPNLRRLMQLEAGEDEENLGYEDFKEVLTDDMDNHDEIEKSGDRRKRRDDNVQNEKQQKFPKFNPPQSVHNPNWKGAMPLYPDEITSMIANKVNHPKPPEDGQELLSVHRKSRDLSDIEYVEDYLSNKYNRLVQQAQAYSDYGVLDGKKESRNEKDSPTADSSTNHKIKLLADENVSKARIRGRLKRGRMPRVGTSKAGGAKGQIRRQQNEFMSEIDVTSPEQNVFDSTNYLKLPNPTKSSEGIRIEMLPTTKSREDLVNNLDNILKIVSKHVKLKPKTVHEAKITTLYPQYIHSTLISTCPKVGLVYNTKSAELTTETTTAFKSIEDLERERGLLFAMTRGNRRLLSTGSESSSDFRNVKDSLGIPNSISENNGSSIDNFVQRLHDNLNPDDERALKNYIEGVKQMNIKIYSTAGPYYDSHRFIHEPSTPIPDLTEPAKDLEFITIGAELPASVKVGADIPVSVKVGADIPVSVKVGADIPVSVKVGAELPPSEITINKSLVKIDAEENFFGKILLTVKDPEFGLQNFNVIFDVPLVVNFKDELMMMNDNLNYPNIYNQFDIFNDTTAGLQLSDVDSYPDHRWEDVVQNATITKRLKRETTVTATWADGSVTKDDIKKYLNATEATVVTIIPAYSSNDTTSSVSAAPVVTLTEINNGSASPDFSVKTNRCTNASLSIGDNMTLSDFFGVIAEWFRSLEYGKQQNNATRNITGSGITDKLLTITSNSSKDSNITSTDSAYPMYDSDMIENIGHRSRVLLSVEDNFPNVTEEYKAFNSTNTTKVTTTADEGNVFNRTTSITPSNDVRSNVTTTKNNQAKNTIPTPKKYNKTKVKLVVKRNADDSNLIFWNDIYDDEYGIQTDKLDNYVKDKSDDSVRAKHSAKEKDFIKKSGRWVQNKIKKFANNWKSNPLSNDESSLNSDSMETKERVPRSIGNFKNNGLAANQQPYDRAGDVAYSTSEKYDPRDEIEEDYPDVDQKSLFAALSLNMKDICKKAAKAVQQTRHMNLLSTENVKTHGPGFEPKEGTVANDLLQQLVRLLTDLVDYQVQQKTCLKLPSDLQNFLEWLTFSKDEDESAGNSDVLFNRPNSEEDDLRIDEDIIVDDIRGKHEEDIQADEMKLKCKQIPTDDLNRYQDNRYSVQHLLEQYDDMTPDEKGKMIGVKDYLEKQLSFLNHHLSAYDLYKFFGERNRNRKKRDVYIMKQHPTTKPRFRRTSHKFIKKYGKTQTGTTAGYHDEAQVTDINIMNSKTNENEKIVQPASENVWQKLTKRNLKDVYYKAVADAKKLSSAKMIQKIDESSRFESSTAKGHK